MNIIIPIGGKGQRFKDENYKTPKPLIKILEKPMISYIIDNLNIQCNDNFFIIYNKNINTDMFKELITTNYPNINLIPIEENTKGAAETLYIGLNNINIKNTNKNIILDCDTFYLEDIITKYREYEEDNCIFYKKNFEKNPIYSYINIDKNSNVIEIKEKIKISDNANTGAYCFKSINQLITYCKIILDNNIVYNNEPYTSCVIEYMIKNNINFKGIELKSNVISLGTPYDVNNYINNTKILLFDLDGTLVNTDYIYIKIWNKLLKKYNIILTNDLFDYFIKGKSDIEVLKNLIPDINNNIIEQISKEKDQLFIKYLENEKNYVFENVKEFFEFNKHNKIAIVTSCNKNAAQYILEKNDLLKYIDLLITSEDCIKHKPDPEPYLKAIKYFNTNTKYIYIFEDSYSGYCSAKRTNIEKISIIINSNSSNSVKNMKDFKYYNYKELKLEQIDNFYKNKHQEIISNYDNKILQIIKTMLPIKNIYNKNISLKTGYICDIYNYNIVYNNNNEESIIIKISNFDNELSKTALKLNMYSNERYFYENLYNYLDNVPKFYGSFKYNNKDAIILEDLNKFNGMFNINLNKNIKLLLKVVYDIFKIHSLYYFQSNEDIIEKCKYLKKINQIKYFKELIIDKYDIFIKNTEFLLTQKEKNIINNIYQNLDKIYDNASSFPLSFCHGDLKSPNIFYKNFNEPIFLDWQYIHLNKGISDIVFLLIESIDFDIHTIDIVLNYYYKLINEQYSISYELFIKDFKNALCIFPLFVCIWFNTEDSDKLLDKIFPIKFMKNLMKYYNYYLQE